MERDKRGDLPPEETGGRSQSLRSTVRLKSGTGRNGWETGVMLGGRTLEPKLMQRQLEKRGKQSRAEGREVGKWKREIQEERERERNGGSVRKGYTS